MHIGARSALSTEGHLSYDSDAPQVRSAQSDSTRVIKVNRHKTNRRKTRPCCIRFEVFGGDNIVVTCIMTCHSLVGRYRSVG